MRNFGFLALIAVFLGVPAGAAVPVGVKQLPMIDRSRADPVSPKYRRSWNVHLFYPAAQDGAQANAPYAPDSRLADILASGGYYDLSPELVRSWATKPGVAAQDAAPAPNTNMLPLILLAPASGMAAFNYSRLAAALVAKGYAVAVVDLPYVGISRLPGGRVANSKDFDGLGSEDPVKWRSAIRQWSKDLSLTLDRLLGPRAAVAIDPSRVVAVGHSTGGIVAIQWCREDKRPIGCGDFEGTPQGSDAFDGGNKKPIFVTASRSAKPDRPFERPDLAHPFWSYLANDNGAAWAIAITKASHMSFSDAPYEMPTTLSRFGGELMAPDRSFALMTSLVDAFARAYAPGGEGDRAFERFLAVQPELLARKAPAKL